MDLDYTLQQIFTGSDNNSNSGAYDRILDFFRQNSVSLTPYQLKGLYLLNFFDLSDICTFILENKHLCAGRDVYFKALNIITLADKVKGQIRLENLAVPNTIKPIDSYFKRVK